MRSWPHARTILGGAATVLAIVMLAAGPPVVGFGLTVAVAVSWCRHLDATVTPR